MNFFVEVIGTFLEVFSLIFFLIAFLGIKFSKVKAQFIAVNSIGVASIMLLKLTTNFSHAITFLCSFLILFILGSLIFKISFSAAFISVVLGLCILLLGELIALLFLGNIFDVISFLEAYSFKKMFIALPHILLINFISFLFIKYKH
ncbi:hypothetical protein A2U94_16455 [Bacillus sp. VT 712]|nr:hypothetical protein A2U94_16455 [Bacillus sp. VT 712]